MRANNFFIKLKNQPLGLRVLVFVAIAVVWFQVISVFVRADADAIQNAREQHSYHLLSVLFLGLMSVILFGKKR